MNRLTYKKYFDMENVLVIDLHNGFSVIALKSFDNQNKVYQIQLRLMENSVGKWDLISEFENIKIRASAKAINSIILKMISEHCAGGSFEAEFDRCRYELRCFDKGNEILEKEWLGGDNNIS
jgi:hypothetical protein